MKQLASFLADVLSSHYQNISYSEAQTIMQAAIEAFEEDNGVLVTEEDALEREDQAYEQGQLDGFNTFPYGEEWTS